MSLKFDTTGDPTHDLPLSKRVRYTLQCHLGCPLQWRSYWFEVVELWPIDTTLLKNPHQLVYWCGKFTTQSFFVDQFQLHVCIYDLYMKQPYICMYTFCKTICSSNLVIRRGTMFWRHGGWTLRKGSGATKVGVLGRLSTTEALVAWGITVITGIFIN